MAKVTVSLLAGIFFLLAQFEFVLHELEHLSVDKENEICEFCVAAANVSNQVIACTQSVIVTLSNAIFSLSQAYRFLLIQDHPAEPARGPPLLQ